MSLRPGRTVCTALCLLTLAATAGAEIVRSPYASGMKRIVNVKDTQAEASVIQTEEEAGEPTDAQADTQAEEPVAYAAPVPESGSVKDSKPKNQAYLLRRFFTFPLSFLKKKAVEFGVGRMPYLPVTGAAEMRFTRYHEIDRRNIVSYSSFENFMKEKQVAEEAAQAEKEAALAAAQESKTKASTAPVKGVEDVKAADTTPVDSVAPTGNALPSSGGNFGQGGNLSQIGAMGQVTFVDNSGAMSGDSSSMEETSAGPKRSQPEYDPVLRNPENLYAPLDPSALLRYFDSHKDDEQSHTGVPFVLPSQAASPLMMQSRATYEEEPAPGTGSESHDSSHENAK